MSALACAVALVMLMDVSGSITSERYDLQRNGVAAALDSPVVRRAIRSAGVVAIMGIQWGSAQETVLPWTLMRTPQDVQVVADGLRNAARAESGETAMGGALTAAMQAFEHVPCDAERLVVDISGDGYSNSEAGMDMRGEGARSENQGLTSHAQFMGVHGMLGTRTRYHTPMQAARKKAEEAGVQVNGLPIVTEQEPDVAKWYEDNVPTNGGFIVVADGFEAFERAMTKKLVQELSAR